MAMKNPFRRRAPEKKESRASRLIMLGLSMPGPIEHIKFEQLSKETYERCVAVYACTTAVMNAAATIEWCLYERSRATKNPARAKRMMLPAVAQKAFAKPRARKALELTEVVDDNALLALIEYPNPGQPKSTFMRSQVGYTLLSGNRYTEFVAPNRKGAAPMEMYSLRPDRVKVIPGSAMGIVGGYRYSVGGNHHEDFAPESIIHHKLFHPTNDWYGLSPLQAAARVIRTDNKAADWNYALIDNQARPSGALISPTAVNDDVYDRLKGEILEGFQGNPGLPLFLEGGLTWQQFSLSPAEIDWLESSKKNRVDICSLYSVPPEIAGDAEHKTYNSMPEARKAFWMEGVLPHADAIRDDWNARLAPLFSDRYYIDYDRDQIDALQEDQRLLWDRVGRADWISVNEARELTGYEDDPSDESDTPRRLLAAAGAAVNSQEFPLGRSDGPVSDDVANPNAKKDPEKKDQQLSPKQTRAQKQILSLFRKHFKGQGAAIAKHLGGE